MAETLFTNQTALGNSTVWDDSVPGTITVNGRYFINVTGDFGGNKLTGHYSLDSGTTWSAEDEDGTLYDVGGFWMRVPSSGVQIRLTLAGTDPNPSAGSNTSISATINSE